MNEPRSNPARPLAATKGSMFDTPKEPPHVIPAQAGIQSNADGMISLVRITPQLGFPWIPCPRRTRQGMTIRVHPAVEDPLQEAPLPTAHCAAPPAQRGIALVAVLACMAIVTALMATAVQSALRSRSDARQHRQLRQAELLVDAGVARAARQLAEDADFESEAWELAPGVCGESAAVVNIKVIRDGDTARVDVVARLPGELENGIQRSESFTIKLTETSNQESSDENLTE